MIGILEDEDDDEHEDEHEDESSFSKIPKDEEDHKGPNFGRVHREAPQFRSVRALIASSAFPAFGWPCIVAAIQPPNSRITPEK
jgi:hypothetical protein